MKKLFPLVLGLGMIAGIVPFYIETALAATAQLMVSNEPVGFTLTTPKGAREMSAGGSRQSVTLSDPEAGRYSVVIETNDPAEKNAIERFDIYYADKANPKNSATFSAWIIYPGKPITVTFELSPGKDFGLSSSLRIISPAIWVYADSKAVGGKTVVTWEPLPDPRVTGYVIYRHPDKDGFPQASSIVRLGTVSGRSASSFTTNDPWVFPGADYDYSEPIPGAYVYRVEPLIGSEEGFHWDPVTNVDELGADFIAEKVSDSPFVIKIRELMSPTTYDTNLRWSWFFYLGDQEVGTTDPNPTITVPPEVVQKGGMFYQFQVTSDRNSNGNSGVITFSKLKPVGSYVAPSPVSEDPALFAKYYAGIASPASSPTPAPKTVTETTPTTPLGNTAGRGEEAASTDPNITLASDTGGAGAVAPEDPNHTRPLPWGIIVPVVMLLGLVLGYFLRRARIRA